jgi:ribosome-binding factor A
MRDPALRRARLTHAIREVLSELLLTEMKDPRLAGVVISEVELSRDLKLARAYFSVIGEVERERQAADGLAQARQYLRREVGRRLRIHNAPDLIFERDRGFERADRIERLLASLPPAGRGSDGGEDEGGDA